MVSTFTPNINLEEPARGDDVGTWDTPVNNNATLLDLTIGANTAVGLGSGNVVLSAAQFKSNTLTFNSTLIQNTTVTFPSTFIKPYIVGHTCTGSSAFTITLQTTVSGGQAVAIPPGEFIGVLNDGTNLKFTTLERVGVYSDYATTSVPAWITACTVPPYLNCTGGTFSSATYPQLAIFLGGTTLPDTRGRNRFAANQGTGRITSAGGGIDGNTIFSGGGVETRTLIGGNIPVVPDTHKHVVTARNITELGQFYFSGGGLGGVVDLVSGTLNVTGQAATVGQIGNSSPSAFGIVPPGYVGGITMIRAA